MKKNLLLIPLALLLAISLVAIGCPAEETTTPTTTAPTTTAPTTTAPPEVIELSWASIFLSMEPIVADGVLPWIQWIEKESGGRVKITFYGDETILGAMETLDGVANGFADMGDFFTHFYAGRFTLNDVTVLPLIYDFPSGRAMAATHNALYNKYPEMQAEFDAANVKVICFYGLGAQQIFTTEKPVHTMEDLEGMTLDVLGPYLCAAVEELGATPLSPVPAEGWDMLAKGVVNGIVNEYNFIWGRGYLELINYVTDVGCLMGRHGTVIMNLNTWNSLPPDIQELFSGESARGFYEVQGYNLDNRDIEGKANIEQAFLEKGNPPIYIVPEDELARWEEAVKPVWEMWVSDAAAIVGEAKARAILEDAIMFAEQYSYENYPRDFPEQVIEEWAAAGQ